MTGTNHSKTHNEVDVEPRNVVEPGGAAQSISITVIIRPSQRTHGVKTIETFVG